MLEFINKPNNELIRTAVRQNGMALRFIKNSTFAQQLEAVKENGMAIKFIKNPSIDIQKAAINETTFALREINHPYDDVLFRTVKYAPEAFTHIKDVPEHTQLELVKINPNIVQFLKHTTPAAQLAAVQKDLTLIHQIRSNHTQFNQVYVTKGDTDVYLNHTNTKDIFVFSVKGVHYIGINNKRVLTYDAFKKHIPSDSKYAHILTDIETVIKRQKISTKAREEYTDTK